MDAFYLLFTVTVVALAYCFYCWKLVARRLPPGPFNPLGNLFRSDGAEAEAYLLGLKRQFGEVCCMNVLGTPTIILNSHRSIRQYYVTHGDAASGRLNLSVVKHRILEGRGILLNDGVSWQQHRRFALSTLRDFGFGKGGTVQIIQDELRHLVEQYESLAGEPVNPHVSLNMVTCNVICSLVFGERCGMDPEFQKVQRLIQTMLETQAKRHDSVSRATLTFLSHLPFVQARAMRFGDGLAGYLEKKLEEHKKNFNGEVNDLIDAYLCEMQKEKDTHASTESFSESNLLRTITDLFIAGTETTATTLRWAMYYMLKHPDVQKRVQDEIDELLQGRLPDPAERKKLVYTEAVLLEVQRFGTIAPLGALPHLVTETMQVDDYVIPKGSLLFANTFAAHRDEQVWPDPYQFNPDNFYDTTNKSIRNWDQLIAFGVGRRVCLGEALAKQEMFVLFVGLLQNFTMRKVPGEQLPEESEGCFSKIRMAPQFRLILEKRN